MTNQSDQTSHNSSWDANRHYQDQVVAADYDASRFSSLPGRIFNSMEQRIILRAFAELPQGARIVDVPCGTGRLAEPLLRAGFRVHGIDVSGPMLDVAANRLLRFGDAFTREVTDAKKLDRTHEQYAAVLCARVLMHFDIQEQIAFLRGVAQLTTGPIVINHSFSSPYLRGRRALKRALRNHGSARFPLTAEEIATLLAGAGLREIKHYRLNRLISEAIYIVAIPLSP